MAEEPTYKVLVTWTDFAEPGLSLLRGAGCEVLFLTDTKDKAEVDRILGTSRLDGVISRTFELDGDALRSCPSLKVISKHGVGVNNIDVAAATALGVPVTSTPGTNAPSVAELTIGLMISAARRIPWLNSEVKQGRWTRVQDGYQLGGRTLGLVGFGQVGRRVASAARALEMDVVVFDPALREDAAPEGVRVCTELSDVLRVANVLSLHVPLTSGTRGLIGREQFELLPDGAILVNTARGPVVDEEAMIDALKNGKLRAAALDTVAHEPIRPDDPLLGLENVFITPHVGGSTTSSVSAVGVAAVQNLLAVLRNEPVDPRAQVNPETFAKTTGVRA